LLLQVQSSNKVLNLNIASAPYGADAFIYIKPHPRRGHSQVFVTIEATRAETKQSANGKHFRTHAP
ncbi:MAG: hypothetical protein IKY37_00135, partial [Bacteroidaceae bacterium]|nr:hypothetical protein [Bacteroidaceae bacterium]